MNKLKSYKSFNESNKSYDKYLIEDIIMEYIDEYFGKFYMESYWGNNKDTRSTGDTFNYNELIELSFSEYKGDSENYEKLKQDITDILNKIGAKLKKHNFSIVTINNSISQYTKKVHANLIIFLNEPLLEKKEMSLDIHEQAEDDLQSLIDDYHPHLKNIKIIKEKSKEKYYLEIEYDFMKFNISILKERLKSKGYKIENEMKIMSIVTDIHTIINPDILTVLISLSR